MKRLIAILLNSVLCQFCLADTTLDDALFTTIDQNDLESAEKLIRKGANVNATNAPQYSWTPLQRASELGRIRLVEMLIAKGASVNLVVGGRTPLHQAAYHGCSEVVTMLLRNGADPNMKGANGETPLHWAANHGNFELTTAKPDGFWPPLSFSKISNTFELLITGGANVNAKAPSHVSLVRHKHPYELDCIVPETNTNTDIGITPLHMVVMNGNRVLEHVLIKHGADVNASDLSGWTLMHWAAANNETNAIARFAARGADLNMKDKDGRTPLFRAKEFNCQEAIEQILDLGGL